MAVGLLLAACFLPGSAWATPSGQTQGPHLTMSATAGYGDTGSYMTGVGAWFPVRVTLVNPAGAPAMRVRVEVDSLDSNSGAANTYVRDLDLPSPARKEVLLYAYSGQFSHAIDVRLLQGNKVLSTVRPALNPLDPGTDLLLGVASSDSSVLNVLNGEKAGHQGTPFLPSGYPRPVALGVPGSTARISVAHISLTDLPPLSTALDDFGVLVFDDVDTSSLSPEQHDALAGWVQRGGTLIATSRPGGADPATGLADLLPVKPSGARSVSSLRSLGDLVSTPLTAGETQVSANTALSGSPVFARVLAQQDGIPLAAVRDLGQGQVAYLALSPSVAPLKGWDGLAPLFKRLLAEHKLGLPLSVLITNGGYGGGYYGPSPGIFDTYGDILDLPGLDLPSGWLMAGFLLLYIILIGPLNFIILRRIKRTELAWATIPAFVVLFSLGAYFMAYGAKGGDIIMPRANITYAGPGMDQATGVQIWGIFSPLRRNYNLSVGADSLVAQFRAYNYGGAGPASVPPRVVGGSTTTVQNVVVDTGGIKGFVSQNTLKTTSPLEGDLHLKDAFIEGTVRNTTGHSLQDVSLIRGDAVQNIGYVAPGARVQVKLPVSARPFNNNSASSVLPPPPGINLPSSGGYYYSSSSSPEQRAYTRKLSLLGMALQPVLSNDPPTDMNVLAVAWSDSAPVSINVEGHSARTEEIGITVTSLPVVASGQDRPMLKHITPYWTYQANNADTPWLAGPPKDGLSPYSDVHFMLPPGTRPHSLSLTYGLGAQRIEGVDMLAYNTQTGAWDRLGDLMEPPADSQGVRSIILPNPGDYTGAGGDVTVRFKAQSSNPILTLDSLDLVLNGGQVQ